MLTRRHNIVVSLTLALVAVCAGCSSTGLRNGDLAAVRINSTAPRAGNVYLIRGWIGVFSTGMDQLSNELTAQGIRTVVYQDTQRNAVADQIAEVYRGQTDHSEPLILIGHSYGADDVVTVARRLDEYNIPVDCLITVDPTTPPAVPENVRLCYNYFQSNITDIIPMFRGIPLHAEDGAHVNIVNVDLRKDRRDLLEPNTNHINIDKDEKLHAVMIQKVLAICPPRHVWLAEHNALAPATQPVVGAHPSSAVRRAADVRTLN